MPGSILLKDKQAKLLLAINGAQQDISISSLAKSTDTTYVHASTFLSLCETRGIVRNEKHGKSKIYRLTEKGKKIADHLSEIYALVSQAAQPANAPAPKPQA